MPLSPLALYVLGVARASEMRPAGAAVGVSDLGRNPDRWYIVALDVVPGGVIRICASPDLGYSVRIRGPSALRALSEDLRFMLAGTHFVESMHHWDEKQRGLRTSEGLPVPRSG